MRILLLLGILGVIAVTISCKRPESYPDPLPMDVVMKVIHEYGRDHHVSPSPDNQPKPDETDDLYIAHISNLLAQEDFAQLEKIAQQDRIEKGHLIGGIWKIWAFYAGTGMPVSVGEPKDSDYVDQIAREKKWVAAYPNSATARLSLADLYLTYAWFARGPGLSDTVSDSQWRQFNGRTARTEALLLEASYLKDKDPVWYELMLRVAHNQGWDQSQERELFDQAVAFEPDFYHYYREYARYLLPEWYGRSGDIQAFAEETAKRNPEPKGSMLYFWIICSIASYHKYAVDDLPHASYPMLKQGYDNVARSYGISDLNANRFAFMATTFKDQPAAREAFLSIKSMDEWTWRNEEIFNAAHAWANH